MNTIYGNLLDIQTGIIVHGVNAQGKFNAGLAKQIREKYPQVYEDYMHHYKFGLSLGQCIITKITPFLYICSVVTQLYFGRDESVVYVDYRAIKKGFLKIDLLASSTSLPTYFSKIGCGLANGDWEKVKEQINLAMLPTNKKTLVLQT